MEDALTRRQEAVLDLLRRRADQGSPAPTIQEICTEFGWRSTRSARDHLRALARKGFVGMPSGRCHRGLRLLRGEQVPVALVPVLGNVSAGLLATADENVVGRIPVPAEWASVGVHFALRVSGDSMQGAGILDGDHVVVQQAETGHEGDIVVATLDGETTLKRLSRQGEITRLVAENPRYRPIDVRT